MRAIIEAVRAAFASIRWTLKSVLRAGVWTLEQVAEVMPAIARTVGHVASAPLRALAVMKPAPARGGVSEPPQIKAVDGVEAQPVVEPTPIPIAVLVRRAARARAAGEPHVGLVPEALKSWFDGLPDEAVRSLAQAAVGDIRGRLDGQAGVLDLVPLPSAMPTKDQLNAMLDRLRMDLAAGRVVVPSLAPAAQNKGKAWFRDHLPGMRSNSPAPG